MMFYWNGHFSGFVAGLKPQFENDVKLTGVRLVQLSVTSAVGAAYLGIEDMDHEFSVQYSDNFSVLFETDL